MEPEGILNGSTTNERIASAVSAAPTPARSVWNGADALPSSPAPFASFAFATCLLLVVARQDREEGGLRDLDAPDLLHALLAFLLFLEKLLLARDVAAVALRGHVLAQ